MEAQSGTTIMSWLGQADPAASVDRLWKLEPPDQPVRETREEAAHQLVMAVLAAVVQVAGPDGCAVTVG